MLRSKRVLGVPWRMSMQAWGVPGVAARFAAVAIACCAVSLGCSTAFASGSSAGSPVAGGSGAPEDPAGFAAAFDGPLLAVWPMEREDLALARAVRLVSPEAFRAREISRTAYADLSAAGARSLIREAFPAVVDRPADALQLPADSHLARYVGTHAAQLVLAGKQHALVESMQPIAKRDGNGELQPISLALQRTSQGYAPAAAEVPVELPSRISAGVSMPQEGVSLTPVDGRGQRLSGAVGVEEGASVIYADTGPAVDTLVKPTPAGFQIDAVLRSLQSPEKLYYKVGMPAGARLAQEGRGGRVRVVDGGATIAVVLPPIAQDAEATAVPTSMSMSGQTVIVSVAHRAGSYRYPIDVDPEVEAKDKQLVKEGSPARISNWQWHGEPSTDFEEVVGSNYLETQGKAEYAATNWASWAYETKGDSKIYEVSTGSGPAHNKEDKIESYIELAYNAEHGASSKPTEESRTELSSELKEPEYTTKAATVCPPNSEKKQTCLPAEGHEKNAVLFEQAATAAAKGHDKFEDRLDEAIVLISEPAGTHSTAKFNQTTPEISVEVEEGGKKVKKERKNVLDPTSGGEWLSKFSGALELEAKDKGIGLADTKLEYESSPGKWELISSASEHNYFKEGLCQGIQCYPEHSEWWILESKLPNGEDKIRYRAEEHELGETESPANEDEAIVKVDTSKPYNLELKGLPWGNELSERKYEVTAEATDGEGSEIAASGVKSLKVYIENSKGENKEITKTSGTGECSVPKGPCTATAEYSLEGAELGAGHHQITIVAIDNAGNEKREAVPISVQHSTPVPLGPGSVDLQSGDYTLGATDVSMGSGLTVTRSYSSRDLTEGEEGALGPQWTMSLGTSSSLVEMPDKSMLLTDANGQQTIFALVTPATEPATYEAPEGDGNLKLTLEENHTTKVKEAFYLEDPAAKTKNKFVLLSGAKEWVPTVQEGALAATDKVNYSYEVLEPTPGKKVVVPHEALAAHPGVSSCSPMKTGCRALIFEYAEETTAKGEAESEWGSYKDRLDAVYLDAWEQTLGSTREMAVAEYLYDKQGRLRAEWDPRIKPDLETIYGYDTEGHVTALTPPGLETWAFTYGTIAGDAGSGRLLKATQAPASAELWKKEAVSNTGQPTISGSAVVSVRMAVSNGTWTGSPVSYGYQWEDCNSSGTECTAIAGANNANYTPTYKDAGHKLVALVTATNGSGSVVKASVASAEVKEPYVEYSIGSHRALGIASGPKGKLWFADSTKDIESISTTGGSLEEINADKESLDPEPYSIASGAEEKLWYGFNNPGGILAYYSAPKHETELYVTGSERAITGVTEGPDGNIWLATEGEVDKENPHGSLTKYALSAGDDLAYDITPGPEKESALWFTVMEGKSSRESEIDKITTSGTITKYALPSNSRKPRGIVAGPEGDIWFTVANGIAKITTSGTGFVEYPLPAGSKPQTIAKGPEGNLWFTAEGTNRIGRITPEGVITEFALPSGSEPFGITEGPDKNIWFSESGDVGKLTPSGYTEGEAQTPGAGITIDYHVPLEGSKAPAQMGFNETTQMHEPAKWGQSEEEDPVEATSIFPVDSPQGWPASSYKRATTYYLDNDGRLVNVATPSKSSYGAVATTEYNEFNDVTRTLTPENRETALKEGCESEAHCKSAEKAKLLDTESRYNCENVVECHEGAPGTRLLESWGPQHLIKYTSGEAQYEPGEKAKEALGRSYTRNYYDEGAPAENPRTHQKETYNLVTKSENLVELPASEKERVDVKTTVTSYSGQEDLGWQLRAPTSVTVNPNSLKLTTTTVYQENAAKESDGQVVETRGPGAEGTFTYASKFGEAGSEAGKLSSPLDAAFDSKGNIWVADTGNSRIEEFGPEGKYMSTVGKAGTGTGQLKEPAAIAINASTGDLWVADTGNHRIQEFNAEGTSLGVFSKEGSEPGELKEPMGMAIDKSGDVWVTDAKNDRVTEFGPEGKYLKEFGSEGSGVGQLKEPAGIAIDSKGNLWVADRGNNRIEEFSAEGSDSVLAHFGVAGAGGGQLKAPFGIAFNSTGQLWVSEQGNSRVQELTTSGAFIAQAGWKGSEAGQLNEPGGLALEAGGSVWVADKGNSRIEELSKGANAREAKIVFYAAEENKEGYANCGKHPEWEGLPCESLPEKQPELGGLPKLPVTTTTYNTWDEPEKIEEVFTSASGAKTIRTKKNTYDKAGRLTGSETTSSTGEDATLPALSDTYNSSTGVLETQSATVKEGAKETLRTITSKYNAIGQLVEYLDGSGNKATYKYAGPENDDLLEEATDSAGGGSKQTGSKQTYSYDETTKQMTKLVDSAAGTFTASYDTEGQMVSEVYPNDMCANTSYNAVNEATRIEYIKTSNCAEEKPTVWYYDERSPSIRGEVMSQTSSLGSEVYGYDQAGRLTEVQETPAGEGCAVRLYAYDEESDRISLTTRKPESKCPTEGGTVEAHNYDEAGRLTDAGVAYDAFGNTTTLPEADAEKHAITSTYYVSNAVHTQEQNGVKHEYVLDPTGRIMYTTTAGKQVFSHYDGLGEAVAWTCEESEKCEGSTKWTRNVPGIDGTLAAVQTNAGTPVLQLHDLQGDVVATAALSPTETKLLSTYNSTEFGVPNKEKAPPPFAWLGAVDIESALSSGVITYGATSYVPQTGMNLQSEAVEPVGEGGSGGGAPYRSSVEPWAWGAASASAAEAPEREAARQRAAAEEAMRTAEAEATDPEEILTPEAAEHEAAVWMKHAHDDTGKLEPFEEGKGAFGLEVYIENTVYEEKFAQALDNCAKTVREFAKHGWKHVGACYASFSPKTDTPIFPPLGEYTWLFKAHVQTCTFVRKVIANDVYACPQTPKYYYEIKTLPEARAG